MRYKTFRTLVVVGAVAAASGAGFYGVSRLAGGGPSGGPVPEARPARDRPVAAVPAPAAPASAAPGAGAAPSAGATTGAAAPSDSPDALRPMDREILARVAQGISGDKAKDAVRGRPWKVNLYQDAGQSRVNRLKIDLDRDDRWDEKWSFSTDGGKEVVKRQVAPADDEAYTREFVLDGDRWRQVR